MTTDPYGYYPGCDVPLPSAYDGDGGEAHNVLCGVVTDDAGCDELEGCPEHDDGACLDLDDREIVLPGDQDPADRARDR